MGGCEIENVEGSAESWEKEEFGQGVLVLHEGEGLVGSPH